MTPSHANKKGIRYRYYVSQAVLQNRKSHGGSISRVSAPDLEAAVLKAIRGHVEAKVQDAEQPASVPAFSDQMSNVGKGNGELSNPELIYQHAEKIVLSSNQITILLRRVEAASEEDGDLGAADSEAERLLIPFRTPQLSHKGILSEPESSERIDPKSRDALLLGIARAHQWMEDLNRGHKQTLEEIAAEERLAERYVRRLMQLAFLSPDIIAAIDNGSAPAGLTLSNLTQGLPMAWKDQERMLQRV
jgi:hypothetical protein